MSTLWMDDFEDYAAIADLEDGIYGNAGTAWSISTANPATGAKSLRIDTNNAGADDQINAAHQIRRVFGSAKETFGVAYRFWTEQLPQAGHSSFSGLISTKLFAFLTEDGSTQFIIVLDTDGSLAAYRGYSWSLNGGGSTFIDRSDPCIVAQSQQHVECKGHVANSPAGYVEIRVNGVTVLNLTEVDLYNADQPTASQVLVSPGGTLNDHGIFYLDDLHAWDDDEDGEGPANFVGNAAVVRDVLLEDTALAEWTVVGAASAWQALNDTNSSTYIQTATVGDRHGMRIAPMDPEVVAIYAKQVNWSMLKTNGGDGSVRPILAVNGEEAIGAEKAATEQELRYFAILATNPDTGAPFEPDDVIDLILERTL